METRLRVRFADNGGFVCSVPAGATLADLVEAVGKRLGLSPEETTALCCRDPVGHWALPDASRCVDLPDDDPESPNLLRTVFVDVFAPRPALLSALWGVPGSEERFLLPPNQPATTRAFLRLIMLNLVARALSGSLFRGPDEARANAELVGMLAFYACGKLLQTSSGINDFERFVRLAGLGQCAAEPEALRKLYGDTDVVEICNEIVVRASALDYFYAYPLGSRWVFHAELDSGELVPTDRSRLPDGRYDFHCTCALVFLGEHGVDARGAEGATLARVRHTVGLHVLKDAVFIEERQGYGLGICSEHPRELLATLEKWAAWRQRDAKAGG